VVIAGYVAAEPDVRGTYTRLEIAAQGVAVATAAADEADLTPTRGRALVDVARYRAFEYGDRVQVTGRLEAPPELEGFDYGEYLAAQGVASVLSYATVEQLEGRAGSGLLRLIYRFKAALQGSIEAVLPHPEAGLLAGILLGSDHTLPEDLMEAFRAVGLVHIIVISGYNIGLVAQAMLVGAGRWLHRWAALAASLGAISLFTLMVGPTPPVLRAPSWPGW
jgi:competence protein ComEC